MCKMKTLLSLMLAIMLTGCSMFAQDTRIIYKDKVIVLEIPVVYLNKCKVTKPFGKEDYLFLSNLEKELVSTSYEIDLLSDLANCNANIDGLNEWYNNQLKLYNPGDIK